MCTVHSFPHNIDHCLTYARSEFEGMLEKSPAEANAFLADPAKYLESIRQVGVPAPTLPSGGWACVTKSAALPCLAALSSPSLARRVKRTCRHSACL